MENLPRFKSLDFLTYSQSWHIYRSKSKRIRYELQTTPKALQPQRKWSNISEADKKAIKELTEKNYLCLHSDKGSEFYVIQDTHTQVTLNHVSDANTYQKVTCVSFKTTENKVNSTWKNIYLQNKLPSSKKASLLQTPTCPNSTTLFCLFDPQNQPRY